MACPRPISEPRRLCFSTPGACPSHHLQTQWPGRPVTAPVKGPVEAPQATALLPRAPRPPATQCHVASDGRLPPLASSSPARPRHPHAPRICLVGLGCWASPLWEVTAGGAVLTGGRTGCRALCVHGGKLPLCTELSSCRSGASRGLLLSPSLPPCTGQSAPPEPARPTWPGLLATGGGGASGTCSFTGGQGRAGPLSTALSDAIRRHCLL